VNFILTHRKIAVTELEIDLETDVISKIGTVFAPKHIPLGISVENGQLNRGDLNDWWQSRSIPASRQNFREAMETLGINSSKKLITKCFGLSLSDQYWINPVEKPLEDENFPYSVCENFISSETELVSAFYIHNTKKIKNTDEGYLYGHYLSCCQELGIPGAQSSLAQMLAADFETHEEQIKLLKDFSWLNLTDLIGVDEEFNEILRVSPFISNSRRDALCFALKERVRTLTRSAT